MKCKAVRRWLRENTVASLDEAPAAVREHGTACPECRATWQRQHDALDLLQTIAAPAAPVGLRRQVMTALPAARPAWRVALGAVPVAAVAILAVVLFGRGPASPVVSLTPGEMHAQTYVQQHALAIAADPLADATALHAIGTLSLRADREAHGVH